MCKDIDAPVKSNKSFNGIKWAKNSSARLGSIEDGMPTRINRCTLGTYVSLSTLSNYRRTEARINSKIDLKAITKEIITLIF